jgi:hypothetical protein
MVEVEEHQMKWRAKENSKNKLGALLVVESSSFRYEKSRCWGWGLGVVLRAKVALQKAKLRGLYSAESDMLEGKSEKTKIVWPKSGQPKNSLSLPALVRDCETVQT